MTADIQRSKKYEQIGKELIKSIPFLHYIKDCKIRIAYVTSDEVKEKSGGRIVYADCNKVDELVKLWCKYDFIIRIYEENVTGMSENQLKILLYHELLHVGINDKTLEPKYICNPHDIEDFAEILDTFGVHWAEIGADVPKIEDVVEWQTRET